jgi:hypothetical protein
MSTLDAGFFFVEHRNVPMHLGSLVVFEGPAPAYRDLVELFAAKLPMVPRYRQVVRTVPMHVFRPAGRTTRTSRSAITCGMPPCRSHGKPGSCATWQGRSSRSGSTATP